MITLLDETGSTNADIAAAIRRGEGWAEGHWLVARRQSAGRGRQGRQWFDGAGNFMGSTAVELRPGDPPPASLSFVAALAVHDAAAALVGEGGVLALKWPNDVLLDGGKLSGILLEMVQGRIIIGIGVNLAHAPQVPERRTAALADVIAPPAPEDFAARLAALFAERLAAWRALSLAPILSAFLLRSIHAPGSPVTVHDSDGARISGTFAGLDETDGALRLRLADGRERAIRAGDVS